MTSDDVSPDSLPTPALVIDATRLRRNIGRLADYAAANGLAVRPHCKTHKSLAIARQQLAAGARGLTVAKVGEGETLLPAWSGAPADLLVAYPAVDAARTRRLAELARHATLRVAVDTPAAIEALGSAARAAGTTIGIVLDLDVGMGRTGVADAAAIVSLAHAAAGWQQLRVDGIFCYPGHIWSPPAEQGPALAAVAARLQAALDACDRHGICRSIVSGGSTPTAFQSHVVPQYTEIRPGTFVFNDMNTVRGGFCGLDDCAARIVCTVVSDAVAGQIVIDAGTKTLTSDRCGPAPDSGHGHVVEFPDAVITRLTEEHGQIDVRACPRPPRVGDRVTVIPNHICPCVNLQDAVWVDDGGRLERLPVDARGRLS